MIGHKTKPQAQLQGSSRGAGNATETQLFEALTGRCLQGLNGHFSSGEVSKINIALLDSCLKENSEEPAEGPSISLDVGLDPCWVNLDQERGSESTTSNSQKGQ